MDIKPQRQIYRYMYIYIDRHTNEHVYRWTDFCRQMEKSMNKPSERQIPSQAVRQNRERETDKLIHKTDR